jgi:hypothetical protein
VFEFAELLFATDRKGEYVVRRRHAESQALDDSFCGDWVQA